MMDLLDCLMPACHQASAVTTPAVVGVTFVAVIALAVTVHRPVCPPIAGVVHAKCTWSLVVETGQVGAGAGRRGCRFT